MEDPTERWLRETREGELDARISALGAELDRSLSGAALLAKYGYESTAGDYEGELIAELEAQILHGDPKTAISEIDWELRSYHEPPAFLFVLRAMANIELGRWEDACDDADRANLADPPYGPAYAVRAIAELFSGSGYIAFLSAERAIELLPNDPRGHAVRAATAHEHGAPGALESADRAVELRPDWPLAREIRALLYWERGMVAEAVADAEFVADQHPDAPIVRRILGKGR
jgi:tetratricopeptide (TPR) repeat protein